LRGRIIRLPELALLAVHGRDVDDPAPAAIEHAVNDLLGDVKQAVEVGIDDLVPALETHLAERAIGRDAGVVDQDIHRSEVVAHLLEGCARRLPVSDIAFRGVHLESQGTHLADPAVLALGTRAAAGDHAKSLAAQTLADRCADAAHPARHVSESCRHGPLQDGAVYKVYIALADSGH